MTRSQYPCALFLFVFLLLAPSFVSATGQTWTLHGGTHPCGSSGISLHIQISEEPFSSILFGPINITAGSVNISAAPLEFAPIYIDGLAADGTGSQEELSLVHQCDQHPNHFQMHSILFQLYSFPNPNGGESFLAVGRCMGFGNVTEFVIATIPDLAGALFQAPGYQAALFCLE